VHGDGARAGPPLRGRNHRRRRPGAQLPEAPAGSTRPRYTDATSRRTDETLALLRYYTANGGKKYCAGDDPTAVDRQWADLYVRLGADRKNVAALLGQS
jgi:glutathione S-transferase